MCSRHAAMKRQLKLCIFVSLMLVVKAKGSCNKFVYTTVNQETTIHINLHSTVGIASVCDVCPGGLTKIESAAVKPHLTTNGEIAADLDMFIFWNDEKNDILLDIPKDSPVLKTVTEEHVIQVDVFYSCRHDGAGLENLNSAIIITLVPVELELKKVEEDNIKENHAIHFTCELKFNGTIPVNAHTSIEITHNKSHPINHCVNKTLCEANVSQAAIPKDEGYYFCSASIKDNSLQHWIHISSKPVFVNIDPDKIAYFGETIGGPIGGSVLFIVVAIAVATIVMRRWKRNFLRRQEDLMQRYWLLGGNAHRNIHQERRIGHRGRREEGGACASPLSVVYGTSSPETSPSEGEYGLNVSWKDGSGSNSSRSNGLRPEKAKRTQRGSKHNDQVYLQLYSDEETTENV